MRRVALLLLLCAGCGSQVGRDEPAAARVTPAMRDACYLALDSEIAMKITFFETLREAGVGRIIAFAETTETCETDPLVEVLCGTDQFCQHSMISMCLACNAAVIDYVYGR